MDEKWRLKILKSCVKKVSVKNMETTFNRKKCFYKVNGKHVRTIRNIKMLK